MSVALARLGSRYPMLSDPRLVQFGYDETDADSNQADWARERPGAGEVLPLFYAVPGLRAAVFTEVNPSYDPSGRSLSRYVGTVAGALSAALSASP
jgi:hypothetical protein